MPISDRYRPETIHAALGADFFDVVAPADFPTHVLRRRGQRHAASIGLDTLTDAEWRERLGPDQVANMPNMQQIEHPVRQGDGLARGAPGRDLHRGIAQRAERGGIDQTVVRLAANQRDAQGPAGRRRHAAIPAAVAVGGEI